MMRTNLSGDLGLGVKSQSKQEIAGSFRNASQCSLAGDRQEGRATNWKVKGRNPQLSC